jgi:hypothetical protein
VWPRTGVSGGWGPGPLARIGYGGPDHRPAIARNAPTAILVPIVKLDFVGLCRALDLVGLFHFVGLRRGSFRRKFAASPAQKTSKNPGRR